MPGPASDSYDPEWGTASDRFEIDYQLKAVYDKLTVVLNRKEPIYILDLIHAHLTDIISAALTEKEWRLLRFAIERARDSL